MKIFNFKTKLLTKCLSGFLVFATIAPIFMVKAVGPTVPCSKRSLNYTDCANSHLEYGAQFGRINQVRFAIRNGATNIDGALCIAAENGHYDIVELLLRSYRANPNAIGGQRHEPALINAARSGKTEIVRLLLNRGAEINGQSDEGMTALMYAITVNKLDMVKLLLQRNANENLTDNYHRNALWFAKKAVEFSHDPRFASVWRNPQDVADAAAIRKLLLH